MIRSTVLDTPIGPLALLSLDDTLIAAGFTAHPDELHSRLHPSLRSRVMTAAPDLGDITKAHLAYFAGDLTALDALPLRHPAPPTRERLWTVLRRVPAGQTVTYGRLAAMAGLQRGARASGQACAKNLIAPAIPCHRVVASTGSGAKRLNGYYYGIDRKAWLLEHESHA
ncbi:MAG TPA: methylated-DNA--[protein]-cysteine S-methyltransferase [Streptosporangiaceae bacterium]|jgi:methylated-DNA-[protein]-cysteine S-methyltransferase|nr:methylated-DNA--[protein]-cysteine S-methyltransferase [Streptosporangiaceae bacterium]